MSHHPSDADPPTSRQAPQPASDDGSKLETAPPRKSSISILVIWCINLLMVGGLVGWLYLDPRFDASIDWWRYHTGEGTFDLIGNMSDWQWLTLRNAAAIILLAIATVSIVVVSYRVTMGRRHDRNTRNWLLLTSIFAMWMAILLGWQDITWLGKQHRILSMLSAFDPVVEKLRTEWPREDGELDLIGPFMAYPVGSPKTLILLTLPELQMPSTTVAVIEGGTDVIRFELVGTEHGDWIEWHPDDSQPRDFISGLYETYRLQKSRQLTPNWHLARYE